MSSWKSTTLSLNLSHFFVRSANYATLVTTQLIIVATHMVCCYLPLFYVLTSFTPYFSVYLLLCVLLKCRLGWDFLIMMRGT